VRIGKPSLISPSGGFFRLGIGLGTGPHGDICGFVPGEAVTVPALPRGGGFLLVKSRPPVHAGGFLCNSRHMSERADVEFKLLLARAFDRAWKRYYRPSRIGAIPASVARPALARHLIALAKGGVSSVDALAEGGLLHLVSLTPEAQHWGHLRIESAAARFQREWRVRKPTARGQDRECGLTPGLTNAPPDGWIHRAGL
jgi:hypothetical protein